MHGPTKAQPVPIWMLAGCSIWLTPWAVALSSALDVGLTSATNFALHSDFRWVLLLPALVWLAGLADYFAKL